MKQLKGNISEEQRREQEKCRDKIQAEVDALERDIEKFNREIEKLKSGRDEALKYAEEDDDEGVHATLEAQGITGYNKALLAKGKNRRTDR